ncbi:MAG: insulinase family protein [Parachlamydiaceae bacterium]|nr:insulinase family protein [Parachlamydiaceae bacterium]
MRLLNPLFKLLALFPIVISLQAEESALYTIIEDQAKLPILTPDFAERKVLKIRLKNGLEAYLVSDPKTDKSGALMTVQAGSWEDPAEYPGMAHFLEHMLFLGTKKYPQESGYNKFIAENGGMTNAFTTNTFTNYMFSVNNGAMEEALDRFSEFFKEPLFNPSGVSRELNAIDQEYAKNLENDDWRMIFIDKELGGTDHPYHNFNIGNSSTLNKVSRETLLSWYHDHYSANLMKLIVVSALPLDQLKDWVVADFSEIPNSEKKPFAIDKRALSSDLQGKIVYIEPVKNSRTLAIVWELPPQFAQMKQTQPISLVCYILGHEGTSSLLAQLKKENLAESLSCGKYKMGDKNIEFVLDITLTNQGIEQLDTVITRCFQAITNLSEKGLPSYSFNEMQQMATINYQYQSREDLFFNLMKQADWLANESLATYPEETLIVKRYDPEAVKELLNVLVAKNAHFYLTAPLSLSKQKADRQERWMGTGYTVKSFDSEAIAKWDQTHSHPDIDLPESDPFIPQHLSLVDIKDLTKDEKQIPTPEALVNNDQGLIYFATDTRYRVPEVSLQFEIKTPHIDMGNAYELAMADLYVKSVTEALSRFSYPALIAGLQYTITRTYFGIKITLSGYSDHADLLLSEILKQMREALPTESEFNTYKESLKREYQNFAKNAPVEQAFEAFKTVLYKRYGTEKQKANAINKISFSQYKEAAAQLFEQTFVEGTIYGNIDRQEAKKISDQVLSAFKGSIYPKDKQKRREVIILPEDQGPFFLETESKMQGNAVVLAIEGDHFDFKFWATQQVLMQAVKEAFFTELRTKQQTGYIVYSDGLEVERHLFSLFAVQSNSHAGRDLLARFELFIEGYLQEISQEFSKERFELIKAALIDTLKQPEKGVADMGDTLQSLAFDYNGDFEWISKRIQGLEQLTYEEFLNQANALLGRTNKRRVAVLLNGLIPADRVFDYEMLKNVGTLRRVSQYGK